ncbi:hypothetical protein [Roseateles paludis]|uniref:Uncharacterized protein n=1 Tax=Roseateles paludis TaxID=3145238 RepID=A0ABV0G0J9_9BURK
MNHLRPTLTALAAAVLCIVLALGLANLALAQDAAEQVAEPAAAPAVLPTVSTTLQRHHDALAYGEIRPWLQGVDQWGEGLYRWDFTLKSKSSSALPSPLKLALATDDAYLPLSLDSRGVFHLPTLTSAAAATAELAANVERGSLSVTWTLAPTLDASTLRAGEVQRLLKVALTLRDKLFRWYQRPVRAPLPLYIRVCAAEGLYAYEWQEGAVQRRLELPLAAPAAPSALPASDTGAAAQPGTPAIPCVRLTGAEAVPADARLVGPAGPLSAARVDLRHAKDN